MTTSTPDINPEQALQTLAELLARETETYDLVKDTMLKKKELLVKGEYKAIPQVDQELVGLGQKSTHLEAERLYLLRDMGHENTTLQGFIGNLNTDQARPFIDARKKLLKTVEEVHDLNQQNQRLLDMSIKWIEDTVETIARAITPEGATYNARGQMSKKAPQTLETTPTQSTVIHNA